MSSAAIQHTPPPDAQPDYGTTTITREQVHTQVTIWQRGAPVNVHPPVKWARRPLSPRVAMEIASWYRRSAAMEAFTTDGTIQGSLAEAIRTEISENDHHFLSVRDRSYLEALLAYVLAVGSAEPGIDMRIRLTPTMRQMRIAAAMLQVEETIDAVVVALALPGKRFGIWQAGQSIEEVPGFWLAQRDTPGPVDSMRSARDYADDAALAHLGTRAGTTAYAYIRRGGDASVFEGTQNPTQGG